MRVAEQHWDDAGGNRNFMMKSTASVTRTVAGKLAWLMLKFNSEAFEFSLTPAFKPVCHEPRMDISRFNGLHRLHVCALLLSLLGSSDLGNVESRASAE